MSKKPQKATPGENSAKTQKHNPEKLMETKRRFNCRGLGVKIAMLLALFVVFWWQEQLDSFAHDWKGAFYGFDEDIKDIHDFARRSSVIIVYGLLWLITIIDEWKASKWRKCAVFAICSALYYDVILFPCGNLVGAFFMSLGICSIAVMIWSCIKKVRVYRAEEELLGRGKVYNEIFNHIADSIRNSNKGLSVAIIGNWGTGKTHCLQYLKHKFTSCTNSAYRIAEVDLWQISNVDDAFSSVASELGYALTGRTDRNEYSLYRILIAILGRGFPIFDISESVAKEAMDFLKANNQATKRKFGDGLGKQIMEECPRGGIILMMDNVERASDEVLEGMLPLIEKLNAIQHLCVVCAIDTKAIKQKEPFNKHDANEINIDGYLSKLFDEQYVLPEITEHGMARMQDFYFEKYGKRERVRNFILMHQILFESPRQIERAIAHLCYVDKHFIDEIERQHSEYNQNRNDEKDEEDSAKKFYIGEWKDYDYAATDVFFVTLLQLLYKGICDEISSYDNLHTYKEGFDFIKYKHARRKEVAPSLQMELALSRSINDDAYKWEERNPVSAELVKNDCLAWSLLRGIDSMQDEHYMYCIERRHERNERLSQEDATQIIEDYAHDQGEIDELILALSEVSTPDNLADSRRFLLSYASHHLDELKNGVRFLHKMVMRIYHPTASDSFDIQSLQQYAASQIFFRPLLINFSRLNLSKNQRREVSDVCECIISHMSFPSLCSMISDLYSAVHRKGHKLYVRHYSSVDSLDIREHLSSSVISDCQKMLAKFFVRTIHNEFDGEYAFERFSNIENYQYFDTIVCISTDLIGEYNSTLPSASPHIWARRLSCILKYISRMGTMTNSDGVAFKASYVSQNHLALLEKHINHIVGNHLVSNCDHSQLTMLKQLAEESRNQLNEGLRLIQENSFHSYIEYQQSAIQLVSSCCNYLNKACSELHDQEAGCQ